MAVAYLARWDGPVAASLDAFQDSYTPPGLVPEKRLQELSTCPRARAPWTTTRSSRPSSLRGGLHELYADGGMAGATTSATMTRSGRRTATPARGVQSMHVPVTSSAGTTPTAAHTSRPRGAMAPFSCATAGARTGRRWLLLGFVSRNTPRLPGTFPPGGSYGDANLVFERRGGHTNYGSAYQYDPLGWTASLSVGGDTAWFANRFTANADGQLAAVSF